MSSEMNVNSLLVLSAAPFLAECCEGEARGEGSELWQHGGKRKENRRGLRNSSRLGAAEKEKWRHAARRNMENKGEETI